MITGHVTSNLEATIRLHIEDVAGQTQAIDVKIDTGFSSSMSLPPAMVASLGLPWISHESVQLADGRTVRMNVHSGVVIWDGKPRIISVHALGIERLIGMGMLLRHDLHIRAIDGGLVQIDLVP